MTRPDTPTTRFSSGRTFAVSAVTPAAAPPAGALPYREALQTRGARIEAHSAPRVPLIPAANGFVEALYRAYQHHHPLILSPDDVWLVLAQGFARHVNAHAETLRAQFVRHQGKKRLEVQRPDMHPDSPDNDWEPVMAQFSERVKDDIGAHYDLFAAEFSTTDALARAAYDVALLDTMQAYFEYAMTLCGIPAITLLGTPNDWRQMTARVERFRPFGLGAWVDAVTPLLQKFADASAGKTDRRFWEGMYKQNNESGGPYLTGWVIRLFPYLTDWKTSTVTKPNPFLKKLPSGPFNGVKNGEIPSGISSAPFTWQTGKGELAMRFNAGFVGVAAEGDAVRPEIGWVITRET